MLKKANKSIMILVILIIGALALVMAVFPDQSANFIDGVYDVMTTEFAWLWLLIGIAAVVATLFILFTKYGDVRLGGADAKPHYSTFTWVSMTLTSALAAGIFILGPTEWVYYLEQTPFGIEAFSHDAYVYASAYGMFHWGFSAWCFYLIPALAIGYMYWNKNMGSILISNACSGVLDKRKPIDNVIGWLIDGIVALCYVGSLLTTIALGTPLIAELIGYITGIPVTFGLEIGVIVVFCLFIILSVSRSIANGMAKLSDFNVKLGIAFLAFVLIAGPTFWILNNFTMSIGTNISEFIAMSFNTDAIGQTGFIQAWTIFYWSWYVGLTMITGIWIARVSYGRTFREIVVCNCFWAPVACWVSFAILGNYGMDLQLTGKLNVSEILATSGQNRTVVEIFRTLPFPTLVLAVLAFLIFLNLATTVTASGTSLAMLTSKDLRKDEEPNPYYKVFWSFLFLVLPVSILLLEHNVEGLNILVTIKSMTTIVAVPILFVLVFLIWSFVKVIREDVKSGEILKYVSSEKHYRWKAAIEEEFTNINEKI